MRRGPKLKQVRIPWTYGELFELAVLVGVGGVLLWQMIHWSLP